MILTAQIARVSELALAELAPLIMDSERAGWRFVRRLAEEWASGVNRFDGPGEALFAAWISGAMVGVGGLNVDPYAGETGIGRLRHLYVLSAYRRSGIGEQLVHAIISGARGRFTRLRLRTVNPMAARFYEGLGFRPVEAADCTHVMELG